jgi:hypothetical protein
MALLGLAAGSSANHDLLPIYRTHIGLTILWPLSRPPPSFTRRMPTPTSPRSAATGRLVGLWLGGGEASHHHPLLVSGQRPTGRVREAESGKRTTEMDENSPLDLDLLALAC